MVDDEFDGQVGLVTGRPADRSAHTSSGTRRTEPTSSRPSGQLDLDEATWDHTIDVNLKGMWLCAKHVGANMVERGGGSRIVNTSTMAGSVASPGLGHYTAVKHGVIGLTKTLAMELAPHDVMVNAVCPTAVDTDMTGGIGKTIGEDMAEIAKQSDPDNVLDEIIQPEHVSAAFMWLSSDDAWYVTGVALPVAAWTTAIWLSRRHPRHPDRCRESPPR